MEKVTEIYLGNGKVGITNFTNLDSKGILFVPIDVPHTIGEYMYEGPYQCVGGEVLVFCSKRESALILLEQVQTLVDSFSGPIDQQAGVVPLKKENV